MTWNTPDCGGSLREDLYVDNVDVYIDVNIKADVDVEAHVNVDVEAHNNVHVEANVDVEAHINVDLEANVDVDVCASSLLSNDLAGCVGRVLDLANCGKKSRVMDVRQPANALSHGWIVWRGDISSSLLSYSPYLSFFEKQ